MDRDSVQDVSVPTRTLSPAQWRRTLLGGLGVVIALLAGGWFYSQGQVDQAQTAFDAGHAAEAQGDTAQAITSYTQATQLKPDYAEAYFRLGVLYQNKQAYDLANLNYSLVIRFQPTRAEAYFNRAADYQAQQSYDQALADYAKVISLQPENAAAYYQRGLIYQKKGQTADARADFTKVLTISQETPLRQQAQDALNVLDGK
jgi:tetratricopeptide (TPR) repeat protein